MSTEIYKIENFAFFYAFLINNWNSFSGFQNKELEYFKWLGDEMGKCSCNVQTNTVKMEEMYFCMNNILKSKEIDLIKEMVDSQTLEFWNNEKFCFSS